MKESGTVIGNHGDSNRNAPSYRYSAVQMLAMDEPKLLAIIRADHTTLVTISFEIARRPDQLRWLTSTLRSPEWREAWMDALICAADTTQVACERMAFEQDRRLPGMRTTLRSINALLHEVRGLVRDGYEAEGTKQLREADPDHTARQWLIAAYLDEFREWRTSVATESAAELEVELLGEAQRAVLSAFEAGDLKVPAPDGLKDLLRMAWKDFRNAVADDAKEQRGRCDALRHPLVLTKWHEALDELLSMARGWAHADSVTQLGPLRVDLMGMPKEEAFGVLNNRRFFAALLQRRHECGRSIAEIMERIGADREEFASPRLFAANRNARRFAEVKAVEYAYIRGRLVRYCDDSGFIDPDLLSRSERGVLKRKILGELGQVAPSDDQIREPVAPKVVTSIKRQVAYALAVMDLEICHRATIRALLPPGRTRTGASAAARRASGGGASINVVSVKFKDALHDLEEFGFIQRGQEFVRVVARQKLYDYALAGLDRLPDNFVDLRAAEAATQRVLDSEGSAHSEPWVEQRRRELAKLRQLMAAPSSSPPRIVHRTGRQERLEVGEFYGCVR